MYARTLVGSERVLGPDHPHTLTARNNLGHAYLTVRRHDEAIPLLERTLSARMQAMGDHRDTAITRENLASAYVLAGRLDEAFPLMRQTWADYKRLYGPDHPETLAARSLARFLMTAHANRS